MRQRGGIISSDPVNYTTNSAGGVFTLNDARALKIQGTWPRGPLAPTSLTTLAGSGQLSLSWTAPATTYGTITNYLVEYTPSGGSAAYVLTNSTSTSYTLTGLTNDTLYSVRVAAVNFTAGDYSATATGTPNTGLNAEYLVVAGGGSGGGREAGGGGGAGGLLTGTSVLTPGVGYTIAVGKGGAAVGGYDRGNSGKNSSFQSFTAVGGGGGGHEYNAPGLSGGSGGGGISTGGSRTLGQGNVGGSGYGPDGGGVKMGGGGGGSGSAGSGAFASTGGDGTPISITGQSVIYAAGGGGGGSGAGLGGSSGVGGTGGDGPSGGGGGSGPGPTSGAANTGSGGGGAGYNADDDGRSDPTSGAGAGGVVVIAVAGDVSATVTGFTLGTSYTRDASTRSGYTVFRFIYGGSSDQLTGTITF